MIVLYPSLGDASRQHEMHSLQQELVHIVCSGTCSQGNQIHYKQLCPKQPPAQTSHISTENWYEEFLGEENGMSSYKQMTIQRYVATKLYLEIRKAFQLIICAHTSLIAPTAECANNTKI